jgi:FkbM family methyltransferase
VSYNGPRLMGNHVLSAAVAKQKRKLDLPIGHGVAARLIAASGALDTPFVLLDVGNRDGINPRWLPLEPAMEVFGFDAIAETAAPNARHHYFKIALGDHDGECRFHVPDNVYEARVSGDGSHTVPMAKIDTLWKTHSLPPADFIKIDCEGYEPEILQGAEQYLTASNLLGAEIETNFYPTITLPLSHFAAINASLAKHRLLVADLGFIPVQRLAWNGMCDVLFARHFINERTDSSSYVFRTPEQNPPLDAILKTIAIFDLYALVAPAAALVREYRGLIARRLDPDALYQTIMLSQPLMIERYLPHLGLGLWTMTKRILGRFSN